MTIDVFAPHIGAVARHFWGEPNARLSSASELRFGAHGARSVDLDKGVWFDNEEDKGGGVLALVARETGAQNGEAVKYLRDDLGIDIPDDRPIKPTQKKIAATYDYVSVDGEVVFQVVRYEPKDFRQRRPEPASPNGWSWSVKGVEQIPYRLPEVVEAISLGREIVIVEGEKDVDALWRLGIPATCNAGGAGKWSASCSAYFGGASVLLLPDNDAAGRNHANAVGASLAGIAQHVRTLELPGLPPKGDISDWLAAGGTAEELHALASAKAQSWRPAAPASQFGAILWSELDSVVLRQDWLVDDMLFCGDFALSYGASQSGKSFLALDMALSIARGVPFLGKKTRKGAVIYQAGEGGKGLVKRQKAYRLSNGVGPDVPFVLLPNRLDLFDATAENGIESFLKEVVAFKEWLPEPLALVVIDTFSTATPGANENASEDVSKALKNIQRIQEAAGCAVLVVHHKNAGGEKPRGHTSLYANADTALEVIRDDENPDERTLRIAKVKDGEDGEKIGFQLQSVTIGTYDDGKPMTSCVIAPAQVGETRTGNTKPLATGQRLFLQCLDDAICQYGGILPANAADYPTHGVEWGQLTPIYKAVRGSTMEDAAMRQALKRDGDELHTKGLIGRSTPWIWITEKGRKHLRYGGVTR